VRPLLQRLCRLGASPVLVVLQGRRGLPSKLLTAQNGTANSFDIFRHQASRFQEAEAGRRLHSKISNEASFDVYILDTVGIWTWRQVLPQPAGGRR